MLSNNWTKSFDMPHVYILLEELFKYTAGLQIYGGPGSLSHDFIIWPISFQGSGPSGPILFSCEKSHFKKNIHFTVSLRTPQNGKSSFLSGRLRQFYCNAYKCLCQCKGKVYHPNVN